MSKKNNTSFEETIYEVLDENWAKTISWQKIYNDLVEKAKQQIKHPHFEYAIAIWGTHQIVVRTKPFWKWFSGKKIVIVKMKVERFDLEGLSSYKKGEQK